MTSVRMWEARTAPGREDDVLAWLRTTVVPSCGARRAELFRAEGRAVLLTWWDGEPAWTEPEPPAGLVERAHAWPFEAVGP